MNNLKIVILLFCTVIPSCSSRKPETIVKKDSVEIMTMKKDTSVTVKKELTTKTGKKFVIIETKPSISVSNYSISGIGFGNPADTIKYSMKNPMTATFLTDLDEDGYDELFIVTKASGPGYFLDILGVTSLEDKTFGEIQVPETTYEDTEKNEKFSGYLGNDSIFIKDNKIMRLFPVYKSSDYNSLPKGGRRMITYSLKRNVSNYELLVSGVENMK
jgi:hypothetical protein